MKLKQNVYQFIIKLLLNIPFKKYIYLVIRQNSWLTKKVYLDLKFENNFDVNVKNEIKFKLNHFGGRIENETFWFGLFKTFENETGWLWLELSKKARTIIDIGANTGIYSLSAKSLNKNSLIYAFEPSKNTFYKLNSNNKLNNFDINCIELALSNKNGEFTLFDSFDSNQTSASMSNKMSLNWKNYSINSYLVKTMRFKDFVEENDIIIEEIDLIKIDVEMFEPEVLTGFEGLLTKLNSFIFIEVLNNEIADKLNLIFNNHFSFYHLVENKKIKKCSNLVSVPLKWNYLACPNKRVKEFEEQFKEYIQ